MRKSKWQKRKPVGITEKQMVLLESLGLSRYVTGGWTVYQAMKRITTILSVPTPKQIYLLKANGFCDDFLSTITRQEASKKISQIINDLKPEKEIIPEDPFFDTF